MKGQHKWTDKNRREFYEKLLEDFGPWKFWATKTNPFSRKDRNSKEYQQALDFDKYLEENWPNAKPKAQLKWLGNRSSLGLVPDPNSDLPTHKKKKVPQPFNFRNWSQNKNSAYWAGFVGDEVFPYTFKVTYPDNAKEAWGQDRVQKGALDAIHELADLIPPDEPEYVEEEDWAYAI